MELFQREAIPLRASFGRIHLRRLNMMHRRIEGGRFSLYLIPAMCRYCRSTKRSGGGSGSLSVPDSPIRAIA